MAEKCKKVQQELDRSISASNLLVEEKKSLDLQLKTLETKLSSTYQNSSNEISQQLSETQNEIKQKVIKVVSENELLKKEKISLKESL